MIKKLFLSLFALLLVLVAAVAVNTLRKGSRQLDVQPLAVLPVDEQGAAQRLGEAVRLRTISSRDDPQLNADQFHQFHALLAQRFPKTHAALKREVVNGLSLLYTWQGSKPELPPVLLLAHQDVVPIAPGTEGDWTVPPFSGDTQAQVLEHVKSELAHAVGEGKVKLTSLPGAQEASKVAPTSSRPYHLMNTTIREVSPDTLVASSATTSSNSHLCAPTPKISSAFMAPTSACRPATTQKPSVFITAC